MCDPCSLPLSAPGCSVDHSEWRHKRPTQLAPAMVDGMRSGRHRSHSKAVPVNALTTTVVLILAHSRPGCDARVSASRLEEIRVRSLSRLLSISYYVIVYRNSVWGEGSHGKIKETLRWWLCSCLHITLLEGSPVSCLHRRNNGLRVLVSVGGCEGATRWPHRLDRLRPAPTNGARRPCASARRAARGARRERDAAAGIP